MRGALALYNKSRCLFVIDRDGDGYEVVISPAGFRPTLADEDIGRRLFGHLRVSEKRLNLIVHEN